MAQIAFMRVHVSGCAIKEINGKFDVCTDSAKFPHLPKKVNKNQTTKKPGNKQNTPKPHFLYLHIANDTKYEHGMYQTTVPEMRLNHKIWVIARIDGNFAQDPLIWYYNDPKDCKTHIPPKDGWQALAGFEPNPTIKVEMVASPKHKATEANVKIPSDKLEELMFGKKQETARDAAHLNELAHKQQKESKNSKKFSSGHGKKDPIYQPQQSKDMRRVKGE